MQREGQSKVGMVPPWQLSLPQPCLGAVRRDGPLFLPAPFAECEAERGAKAGRRRQRWRCMPIAPAALRNRPGRHAGPSCRVRSSAVLHEGIIGSLRGPQPGQPIVDRPFLEPQASPFQRKGLAGPSATPTPAHGSSPSSRSDCGSGSCLPAREPFAGGFAAVLRSFSRSLSTAAIAATMPTRSACSSPGRSAASRRFGVHAEPDGRPGDAPASSR